MEPAAPQRGKHTLNLNDVRVIYGRAAPELHRFSRETAEVALEEWRKSLGFGIILRQVLLTACVIAPLVFAYQLLPLHTRWVAQIAVVGIAVSGGALFPFTRRRSLRKFLRRRLTERGIPICLKCGYDLRGLTEPRCPECGADFDPRLLDMPSAQRTTDDPNDNSA